MDNSPLTTDYTKSKKSESSKVDQQLATHLPDTVDYYIGWKLKEGRGFVLKNRANKKAGQ